MTQVSPDDAARNLSEIEQVAARSSRVYGYAIYSRYLILWGVVSILGQAVALAWPGKAAYVWWALILAAIAVTCLQGRRPLRAHWRVPAVILIALGFIAAVHAVADPVGARLGAAITPLVMAAAYAVMGLWLGVRFTVLGLALAAAIVLGFVFAGEDFKNWLGFVGGGALVLAGFWLRRI